MELEADIRGYGEPESDLAQRAAVHLLAQPGKRIRPLCVVLAARLGEDNGRSEDAKSDLPAMTAEVRDLAVACELAHAATLLHDDVLDQGTERRGAPTSRVVYGNSASILGGDHLMIEALRRVHRTGRVALVGDLMQVISNMVIAEAWQLEQRGSFVADANLYMRIVSGKTAAIFDWGMRAGATAGKLSDDAVAALGTYGHNLGIAFQLADDILDLTSDVQITGKDALADIRDGKLTWPLIIACERKPELEQELREIAASGGGTDGEKTGPMTRRSMTKADYIRDLRTRLQDTGCVDATRDRARQYASKSRTALEMLSPGPAKDALGAVIDVAVERAF